MTPVALGRRRGDQPSAPDADTSAKRSLLRTILVTMPIADHVRPSLPLGLLAAIGRQHGFPVDTFHAHLDFARMVGRETAIQLAEQSDLRIGEWLFGRDAFGDDAPGSAQDMLDQFGGALDAMAASLSTRLGRRVGPRAFLDLRQTVVPEYLDRIERAAPWSDYDVVGFSSNFQQNVATIAMARRLKERHPHLVVIAGGANFEGPMGRELMRATPWFDHAVSGEGDDAFPALLAALADGRDPGAVPGVLSRCGGEVVGQSAPPVEHLDRLPVPDFDEFFARSEQLGLLAPSARRSTSLPFESSRGCWWGQRRHCTFCGLNGGTMAYRSKSPARVVEEINELTRRYRSHHLRATDNILDEAYFDELLPALIAQESDADLLYEIKANLDRDRIRMLSRAGVKLIQPGIESLSSHVLRLMDKGVKAATNVNTLRWATHYGVHALWFILYGFPGETREDYKQQADLARQLVHLRPPLGVTNVRLERFSPMFDDRERFPVEWVRPERSYELVYPQSYDLERVAYFFDHAFVGALADDAYDEIREVGIRWQEAWAPGRTVPTLELWRSAHLIQIEDRRDEREPVTWTFEGDLRTLYLACFDSPQSVRTVAPSLPHLDPGDLERALGAFVDRGLMMRDGNLYLALALPRLRRA